MPSPYSSWDPTSYRFGNVKMGSLCAPNEHAWMPITAQGGRTVDICGRPGCAGLKFNDSLYVKIMDVEERVVEDD